MSTSSRSTRGFTRIVLPPTPAYATLTPMHIRKTVPSFKAQNATEIQYSGQSYSPDYALTKEDHDV